MAMRKTVLIIAAQIVLAYYPGHAAAMDAAGRIDGFEFTQYAKSGDTVQRKFTISADSAVIGSKRIGLFVLGPAKEIVLANVKMTFYSGDKPVSALSANKCVSDYDFRKDVPGTLNGKLTFTGAAELYTMDRKRALVAWKVTWYNSGDIIEATGNPMANEDGKISQGDTIRTDINISSIKIEKRRR